MDCKDIDKLITAYLEGAATPEEQEQVQAHIDACSQCREELEVRQTSRDRLGQALRLAASQVMSPADSWDFIAKQAGIKEGDEKPIPKKSSMAWLAVPLSILLLVILIAGLLPGLGGKALPPPEAPVVVNDGAGGAILVWQATPYNGRGIYAQHVDAGGNPLWGAEGQQIAAGKVNPPKATSDGSGGAIIAWGDGDNRYVQRLDSLGRTVWKQEEAYPALVIPGMVGDGSGGAILLWEGRDNQVYAQRVGADGASLWGVGGRGTAIGSIEAAYRGMPMVNDDSGGAVLLWEDFSSRGISIHAQRVSHEGKLLWGESGVRVTADGETERPQLINDGTGSYIITWCDRGDSTTWDANIYAQKLDADGQPLWGESGILVCSNPAMQSDPQLTGDGTGGCVVAWNDSRNAINGAVFAQRISSAGKLLWEEGGVRLSDISDDYFRSVNRDIHITGDGAGGSTVVWGGSIIPASRQGEQVYAQKLDAYGQSLWADTGVKVFESPPFRAVGYSSVISDEEGGFIIGSRVSEGSSASRTDSVYVQRVASEGNRLWGDGGLEIQRVPSSPILPIIVAVVILVTILVLIGVFRGNRLARVFTAIAPVLVGIVALFSNLLLIGPLGYSYAWAYILDTPVNFLSVAVLPIAGLASGVIGIWRKTAPKWVMIPIVVFGSLVTVIIEFLVFALFF